jgi:hypothetical protein
MKYGLHSGVRIRTHDLSVMSLLPYPLDHGYSPCFSFKFV